MTEPADEVLKAAAAAAVGVAAREVRVESTHASRVFVAGDRAFKFKRRVDLGFLNFVSLEARHHACCEEVRLNRRLAPEVYLGVAALRRKSGSAAIDDWCVVMRALPQERMLNRLLDRGEVGEREARDLERLMARMAEFHRGALRGPEIAALSAPDAVRARLEQVLQELAAEAGSSEVDRSLDHFLAVRARAMLEDIMPVLESRRARGCVVDGHGDLHAGNICMVAGGAVAYDCLEFSQSLRVRDTSAEIAFLAMDLQAHGRGDLAERVVAAYLAAARAQPEGAARAVDFLDVQRWFRLRDALVRALVARMRAKTEVTGCEASATSRRFVNLACGYALKPSLVLTCGVPGSGKSTLARAVAVPLGAEVLRSDAIRKELGGVALTERGGRELYTPAMTRRVYQVMIERAAMSLRAGVHVVLDAAFPARAWRAEAIGALAPLAEAWVIAECTAPEPELRRRLEGRAHDPTEVSDADAAVMRTMAAEFEAPEEIPASHRLTVDLSRGQRGADAAKAAAHAVIARLVAVAPKGGAER